MNQVRVDVVMNGVTGRMGYNQHLVRSILAIQEQGGVPLENGSTVWPDPILVGRNPDKLRAIAERHGLPRWTTDLDAALSEAGTGGDAEAGAGGPRQGVGTSRAGAGGPRQGVRTSAVYFDALATREREKGVRQALDAGLDVYCEKPLAGDLAGALDLVRAARAAGVRTGVVQDKLFLPGLRKLAHLVATGFFGRVLAVRGEFGYWVLEGHGQPSQRPSWNYRTEDGGGIVLDMFPHWTYVLEGLFGPVRAVQAVARTHIPERVDERGMPYACTADDAAYAVFELDDGVVAQVNSSWAVRVHRDELVEFQVDGTDGSAVAGLRRCRVQHRAMTPRPVWNPDVATDEDYRGQWAEVPDTQEYDNGFKQQWEQFLRHVVTGGPWSHDFLAGARGVQVAELGLRAAREGRRVEVPPLELD